MSRKHDDFGLLDHLDDLLKELHDNVPKALKQFDTDGIHDARVATRRLKAAMGLLESVLSDNRRKDFEKVLKKVRRRLGPLRDLDVMIEHLAKLETHGAHGPAAAWLKAHLEAQRDAAREEAKGGSGSADVLSKLGAWWHVREEIVEAREAIDSLLAESLHLQLDAFAEQAAAIVLQTLGTSNGLPRQDPHQLRISGKLLRYTLEIAQSEGHELPAVVVRQFKQMQESLGNWHDDVVLVQCAMQTSIEKMLAYHDLPLQDQVLELNRFFLKRAARELSDFSKLWQRRGEEVARTIRERFPLTRPAPPIKESKTDPGPSDLIDTPVPAPAPPDVVSPA